MATAIRAEMEMRAEALRSLYDEMTALVAESSDVADWRRLNSWRFAKLEKVVDHLGESIAQIQVAFGAVPGPSTELPGDCHEPIPELEPGTIDQTPDDNAVPVELVGGHQADG